jgi:hypothetical protein
MRIIYLEALIHLQNQTTNQDIFQTFQSSVTPQVSLTPSEEVDLIKY